MKNSKLIRILSVLKKEEFHSLERYIKSQIKDKNDNVWLFFRQIEQQLTQKEGSNIEKEFLFKKLYPKQTYNDGKMRRLMHELLLQVENYIYTAANEKPFAREKQLLDFYVAHYATKDFSESLQKLTQSLAEYSPQDVFYWETKAQLEIYRGKELGMNYVFKNEMNIPNIIQSQTTVFFIHQLKYHFYLLANQNLAKKVPFSPFFHQILQEINENLIWRENPLINIYYACIQLFIAEDATDFFEQLRQLVLTPSAILPHVEWASIAFSLRNYASRQRKKQSKFTRILFELFFEHLPLGFVFSNNHISPQAFIHIVNTGITLNEIAQINTFVAQYEAYLQKDIKENILLLSEALILHGSEQYNASLQKLTLLKRFEHYTFELSLRILIIKNYCCLQEWELCISQLHSFKMYVYRHDKLNEDRRISYQNFIKIMLLFCQNATENKEHIQTLKAEVEQTDNISSREWLLQFLS